MNYKRIQFQDLFEIIIARKILIKADEENKKQVQRVKLSLIDFYQSELSLNCLEELLRNQTTDRFNTIVESVSESFSMMFNTKFEPHKEKVRLIDYYNSVLEQDIKFLKNGDDAGLEPCIENYTVIKDHNLYSFEIDFVFEKVSKSIVGWFDSYFGYLKKIESLLKAGIKGSAPTFRKQSEFFLQKIIELQKAMGANKVNIGISDWKLRLSVLYNENIDLLHAFNLTYKDKALIPIYLEMNGLIDVIDFSIVSSALYPEQIDLQYSISKPSIKNLFEVDTEFIDKSTRKNLAETQLVILDKTFDELRDSFIFEKRRKITEELPNLLIWLVKRIQFCLEEEGYLRNKAVEWYNQNKNNKYMKMEDDFFLPFIYEKLVDKFGNNNIIKKPEKYKGEIDLLYKNLVPIELKVWIDKNIKLEYSVDEKFPNSSQAAAYASENRVGILLVLDLSFRSEGITNLENCWKVVTKSFEINEELPTKIIVPIFHCSYLSPSSYK